MKNYYFFAVVVVILCACLMAEAQQEDLTCVPNVYPVSVLTPSGQPRGVRSDDLVASLGAELPGFENERRLLLPITSVVYDDGPRRIVFVVDGRPDLTPEDRNVEGQIVERFLASARSGDSFALIATGGGSRVVPFGSGNEAVRDAALALATDAKGSGGNSSTLDALFEATKSLGGPDPHFVVPEPGDSIVVFARDLGRSRSTTFEQVSESVHRRNVRVFTVFLQHSKERRVDSGEGSDYGKLYSLARISGGYFLEGDPNDRSTVERVLRLYPILTTFYRIEVVSAKSEVGQYWKVQLTSDARRRWPNATLLYPMVLGRNCWYHGPLGPQPK